MADVSFDGTNLTGSGSYTSNISASGNLISKATDTSSTITLSNNTITVSGEYFHDLGNIVFENGTTTTISSAFNIRGDNTSTPAVTIDGTFTCGNFVVGKVYNSGATKGLLNITNNANITARGYSPIGNTTSAQGTVNQSGGSITFTNEITQQTDDCIFRLAAQPSSTGIYNLSGGTLTCLNALAAVGYNATGTFTITGGTANFKGLKMTHANSSNGTLNLYGGELKIAGSGVTKGNGTATINLGQGTVSALANHTWNSALSINLNGRAADSTANVANGQTTFNSNGKTITLASKLTGVGALVKNGSGNLVLSNTGSSFTGNIIINNGQLTVSGQPASNKQSSTLGNLTTSGRKIVVNNGATLSMNGSQVFGANGDYANIALDIDGGTLSNDCNSYNKIYNLTFRNGSTLHIANGDATWQGVILFSNPAGDSTVNILKSETRNSTDPVRFTTSGAANANLATRSAVFNVQDITNSANGGAVDNLSDLIIEVPLKVHSTGTCVLTKDGPGTMELTAANSNNGPTTILAGTLKLSGAGTLGAGAVTVDSNATLEIAYDSPTTTVNIPSITMAETSAIKVASGTVTFGTNSVTLNNLSGGGLDADSNVIAFINAAEKELTLNNDAMTTFIGSITAQKITVNTINDVALKLYTGANNKVTADSLTVSSGELDFKGYFEGSIEVFNGSVFSPGNSVGTADITGNITFTDTTADSNGVALFEFGEYADGADVNHDLFVMENGGIFTADDGVILLDFANNDENFWATAGNKYLLVSGGGFADGDDNYANWLVSTPDYSDLFKLTGIDGSLYLVGLKAAPEPGSGVPEPSTWALLALGVVVLFLRKRVRN